MATKETDDSLPAARQTEELRRLKQAAAARLIGMTSRFLRDSDAPRNLDGTYDAHRLLQWFIDRGQHPTTEHKSEKARREAAEAGLAELKLQEKAGELVSRQDVLRNLDAFAQRLRKAVDELSRRASVKGRDVQQCINKILDESKWH